MATTVPNSPLVIAGDRGGLLAREANAVGVGKDVRGSHLVRGLTQGAKELEQHSGVSLDGSHRAGAPFFFGQESVNGLLPMLGFSALY